MQQIYLNDIKRDMANLIMPKKEVRIIAWDDCAFAFNQASVRLVGVVFRGGDFLDGMLSTTIEKDGIDATKKISRSILKSRHFDQLSYIMTNGISFAGLNILDIAELHKRTGLPVIVVIRKMPDMEEFIKALNRFIDSKKRTRAVVNAGAVNKWKEIYYQIAGIEKNKCEEILKLTCTRSKIPEPLRVAHLIASGLSRPSKQAPLSLGYESRGRA
jgi:uncharacterized protein